LSPRELVAVTAAALCHFSRSSAALPSAILPVSKVLFALNEAAREGSGAIAHPHFETRIL